MPTKKKIPHETFDVPKDMQGLRMTGMYEGYYLKRITRNPKSGSFIYHILCRHEFSESTWKTRAVRAKDIREANKIFRETMPPKED